ncbi:MAG: DUF1275 domain-containing protein [Streptococcaceae bacterium]|jgi:uncharacterized membrane protein YoaK (UPF0700 family)|nr:DUF1275 domain-containing protein [Streptococcaceae bacterium]
MGEEAKKVLIYEELEIGMLLAAAGGFMDAYSYLTHGQRFANLQSGNVILMAIHLIKGQLNQGWVYLFPIFAFAIGAGVNFLIKDFAQKNNLRRHQLSLLAELIGVTICGLFVSVFSNNVFISLLSFFAAIQADTFKKLRGMPYANIMMTGNIRTIGSMLIGGIFSKNFEMLVKGRNAFLVVVSFFLGALFSATLVPYTKNFTILGASILLWLAFIIIRRENKLSDKLKIIK